SSAWSDISGSRSLKNRAGTGTWRPPGGKPCRLAARRRSFTASGSCIGATSTFAGLYGEGQVFEPGRARMEAQVYLARGSVAVLGDDDRRHAGRVRTAGLIGLGILPIV